MNKMRKVIYKSVYLPIIPGTIWDDNYEYIYVYVWVPSENAKCVYDEKKEMKKELK